MRTTLLGSPISPQMVRKDEKRRDRTEKLELIFKNNLQAYLAGEMTLVKLMNESFSVLNRKRTQVYFSEGLRDRLLGSLLRQALSGNPKMRDKNSLREPSWISKVALKMIPLAQRDRYSTNQATANKRTKGQTAFDQVSKKFKRINLSIAPTVIEAWYKQGRKKSH